ncbi:hypothetical protein MMC16_002481 [Acarospora aff. strigata]|nr:hypothetical protein [Acarospora aff. strigata]
MPKAVAKRALSPTLSSDSSLSSAPDITDIAIEDTTTPISLDQKGTKALVEETAVDITVSNKRRRIGDAKETKPPPKRTRRETVNRASHKEATEEERDGEEEVKKATKFLEKTSQKRSRRIKASTNGLKHAAVKTENKGEIEVISRGTTRGIKKSTKVKVEALSEGELSLETPKGSRKKAKAAIKAQEEKPELSPEKPRRSRKGEKAETEVQDETQEVDDSPKKPKKKRKTKEEKEAEAMPLAVRTTGLKVYIGAHVSSAKGVQNSVTNCLHIGGNAFALFLKSQRKWENPPLQDENKTQFRAFCADHKYDAASHVLPHGSYLVNLAQEDPDKAAQAYTAFIDDLHRCEALGIKLYNFHPGWTGPSPRPTAISRIAHALNRAHASTTAVTPLLETMAGGGTVIGSRFEDLRDIISLVTDKSRIGVCLDTCHTFAAGYDIRTPETFAATLAEFDQVVGLRYLKALHLNDSKAPLGSRRDLHQNIGLGFLGLRAFWNVVNESRCWGVPMVLETPIEVAVPPIVEKEPSVENPNPSKDALVKRDAKDSKDAQEKGKPKPTPKPKTIEDKRIWAREIKLLESLVGMDPEGEEFRKMERDLAEQGREERDKYQEAWERKVEKERVKEEKKGNAKGRGKKKGEAEESAGSESGSVSGSGSE